MKQYSLKLKNIYIYIFAKVRALVVLLLFLLVLILVTSVLYFSTSSQTGTGLATSTQTTVASVAYSPVSGIIYSISCPTNSFCIAVGESSDNHGLIEGSTGSLSSFSSQLTPANITGLRSVSCANSTNCVAIGGNNIIYSSNGGQSWQETSSPVANASLASVSCTSTQCVAVGSMPSAYYSDLGVILRSTNLGVSWQIATYPNSLLGLSSVSCVLNLECVAVGASVVYSSNGGQSWQTASVAGGIMALSSVSCGSPSYCIALGANPAGQVNASLGANAIVSTNGGESWNPTFTGSNSAFINTVSCQNTNCVSVGPSTLNVNSSIEIETQNSGSTWFANPEVPPSVSLKTIAFAGSQVLLGGSNASGAAIYIQSANSVNEVSLS